MCVVGPKQEIRKVPVVAPHSVVQLLLAHGLSPGPCAAKKFWAWHGEERDGDPQPLFLYGDDAEITKYGDKVEGVYLGATA